MEILKIRKSYRKKTVLKDITLKIEKGQCIGILGCNGSGKSTLLNILAGILKADGGEFIYEGVNLLTNSKIRSKVLSYVPQSPPLLDELSALDNLRLWYAPDKLKTALSSGVPAILGINEFLNTPVFKMSGGMKKKLSIACAVATEPEILLLDEPVAALDFISKAKICDYIEDFKAKGKTAILTTHDLQELAVCDKLYIVKDGVLKSAEFDGDVHRLAGML